MLLGEDDDLEGEEDILLRGEDESAEEDDVDADVAEESELEDAEGETAEVEIDVTAKPQEKTNPEPEPDTSPVKPKKLSAKKRRRTRARRYVNLTSCKYESVRRATKKLHFKQTTDDEEWTLFWTDCAVTLERVMDMKIWQKVNHFPGMLEICRKDLLARNMNRLFKQFPKEYKIFPKTWCLPADYFDFQQFYREKKNKVYILKPDSGAQGRGIFLTKTPHKDVKAGDDLLCQQYMTRPFLIDDMKFDMRVYVLVKSCDPLRLFVYEEGLARFATVKYQDPTNSNVKDLFMHLTNYSIQKNSDDFIRDEESGSKRRLSTLNKWFIDHRVDPKTIWDDVDDVIIKTLISAHPILRHNYRTCFPNHVGVSACFEILGFDIMLDKNLKPWVLEVNHSPSFTTDSKLDREIKDSLIYDSLVLVNFNSVDRKRMADEDRKRVMERLLHRKSSAGGREDPEVFDEEANRIYEDAHLGQYRRIYPENGNEEKYRPFFENSCSLYQETAASKRRAECAKEQREEIAAKKEFIEKMRKKNSGLSTKESSDLVRPESAKRVALRNRQLMVKRMAREAQAKNESKARFVPIPINERDEDERLAGMVQRESLMKALNIRQYVEKILSGEVLMAAKTATRNEETANAAGKLQQKHINIRFDNRLGRKLEGQTIHQVVRPPPGPAKKFAMPKFGRPNGVEPDRTQETAISSSNFDYGSIFSCPPQKTKQASQPFQPTGPGPPAMRAHPHRLKKKVSQYVLSDQQSNTRTSLSNNRIHGHYKSSNQNVRSGSLANQNTVGTTNEPIKTQMSTQAVVDDELTEDMRRRLQLVSPASSNHHVTLKAVLASSGNVIDTRPLSVTSSPVPMMLREDTLTNELISKRSIRALEGLQRSTRAQRIRGLSNSSRLKQIELYENRELIS